MHAYLHYLRRFCFSLSLSLSFSFIYICIRAVISAIIYLVFCFIPSSALHLEKGLGLRLGFGLGRERHVNPCIPTNGVLNPHTAFREAFL